jgi:hypothetical protein
MSLNKIELKPQLLADLYSNTLVEGTTNYVPEPHPEKYLGKNHKKILVIVSHDSLTFLPDTELSFLITILSACKLSLADIAIINKDNMNISDLPETIRQLEANKILLFGTEPLAIGLPINFPQFQLQQFDKRTYLYSPPLSEIEIDKAFKSRLWSCLKNLFSL